MARLAVRAAHRRSDDADRGIVAHRRERRRERVRLELDVRIHDEMDIRLQLGQHEIVRASIADVAVAMNDARGFAKRPDRVSERIEQLRRPVVHDEEGCVGDEALPLRFTESGS